MSFLSIIFPLKCVSCGKIIDGETPLCETCREIYEREKRGICNICKSRHCDCRCKLKSNENYDKLRVLHLAEYNKANSESVVSKIVFSAKKKRLAALDNFIACELAHLIKHAAADCEGAIVTNVPRSKQAKLDNGTDQAENFARKTAGKLGMIYVSAFSHIGTVSQKELSREERQINAHNSFRIKKRADKKISGKIVILIDDVITTGSTMLVCVELLRAAGALAVICVSIGRTQNKNKTRS